MTPSCVPRASSNPSVAGQDTLAARVHARNPPRQARQVRYATGPFGPPVGAEGPIPGDVLGCTLGREPRICHERATRRRDPWERSRKRPSLPISRHRPCSSAVGPTSSRNVNGPAGARCSDCSSIIAVFDAYLWYRYATNNPIQLPSLPDDWVVFLPAIILVFAVLLMVLMPLMNGKSPHITVYPEQVEFGLTEIKGLDTQVDEVLRTLDVFLGYATFRDELGGTPRRGILFEGPPGHRQDLPREGDGQAGRRAVPVHLGDRVPVDVVRDDGVPGSVRSSRHCGRRRARKGARSASSRRSTRSAGRATASACRRHPAT